jgi:hypothetical protein
MSQDNRVIDDANNDPEVIRARAEAKEKVLRARAQLHWTSQLIYTFGERIESIIYTCGCLAILFLAVFAFFGGFTLFQ